MHRTWAIHDHGKQALALHAVLVAQLFDSTLSRSQCKTGKTAEESGARNSRHFQEPKIERTQGNSPIASHNTTRPEIAHVGLGSYSSTGPGKLMRTGRRQPEIQIASNIESKDMRKLQNLPKRGEHINYPSLMGFMQNKLRA